MFFLSHFISLAKISANSPAYPSSLCRRLSHVFPLFWLACLVVAHPSSWILFSSVTEIHEAASLCPHSNHRLLSMNQTQDECVNRCGSCNALQGLVQRTHVRSLSGALHVRLSLQHTIHAAPRLSFTTKLQLHNRPHAARRPRLRHNEMCYVQMPRRAADSDTESAVCNCAGLHSPTRSVASSTSAMTNHSCTRTVRPFRDFLRMLESCMPPAHALIE